MSTPRVDELRALGLRSRVLEAGESADGEAIVLLHGGPGSADDWQALLPRLGALRRTVAFDLPGFGEADKPADYEYSPYGLSVFVAAALDELGVSRAHVVMSDVGGQAGLVWAAAHRERLASAVVSGVFAGPRWHLIARAHRTPLAGPLVARAGRGGLRPVMRVYDRAPHELPKPVVRRWARGYRWPTRRAMLRFYRSAPASSVARVADALRPLDRPALLVWGAHDRFVPPAHAARHRAAFPHAELVVLPDSGHYPHVDDPDRTAEVIVPFLEGQLA